MIPILSGNVASATASTGYEVDNSCRFNDDDSPYMHKTPGSAGNRRTWTISCWVKKSYVGGSARKSIIGTADTEVNGDGGCLLRFENDGELKFESDGGVGTSVKTNAKYRDHAWYHIVLAVDTTQGSASNRVKIYINGVQETSLASTTYPSQNKDYHWNNTVVNYVGGYDDSGSVVAHFDGYMAEFFSIDGSALTPSSFGEFDEDSPTIWKPKDCKDDLTFGTNGFYLDFEDSSNLGNDANGGTDLTEVNLAATDQATDTPTNNFCTINPLYKWYATATLSEGNCKVVDTSGGWAGAKGTMAVSKGKWYWEIKLSGTMANHQHGVQEINVEGASAINPGNLTGTTSFYNHDGGEVITDGSATTSDYGTLDSGDILGIALNMDGGSYGQITIYDQNSAIASNINLSSSSDYVMPASFILSCTAEFNFGGCSSFTISSAANDENGYGNFEFAPPSGYLALCTKNLATDG